jgi:hypothetical protein
VLSGGTYLVQGTCSSGGNAGVLIIAVNGTPVPMGHLGVAGSVGFGCSLASAIVNLTAGNTVSLVTNAYGTIFTPANNDAGGTTAYLTIVKLA